MSRPPEWPLTYEAVSRLMQHFVDHPDIAPDLTVVAIRRVTESQIVLDLHDGTTIRLSIERYRR